MPTQPPSPPHSTDAERTTIGALLMDPDRIVDVAPAVQARDFYDPTYRKVFAAIRRLYDDRKPIDFVTVAEVLRGDDRIEALGGSAFLAGLAANVPTSSHAVEYAGIVRDKAMHRQLLDAGTTISALARDEHLTAVESLEK